MRRNSMEIDLSNKPAVVTGGAMGIGEGIVRCLAAAGAPVLLVDKNERAAEETTKRLQNDGFEVTAFAADITDEEQVIAMYEACLDRYGSVRTIVTAAGVYPRQLIKDMSLAAFKGVLDVNLNGAFLATKYGAEAMLNVPSEDDEKGSVVLITSIDSTHPLGVGLAAYDASKHGVKGFMQSAALELAPHGIRVNALAPGGVVTPGIRAGVQQRGRVTSQEADLQTMVKAFVEQVPMGRMGTAEEVGRAAVFLASSWASYIDGTELVVDGGRLIGT